MLMLLGGSPYTLCTCREEWSIGDVIRYFRSTPTSKKYSFVLQVPLYQIGYIESLDATSLFFMINGHHFAAISNVTLSPDLLIIILLRQVTLWNIDKKYSSKIYIMRFERIDPFYGSGFPCYRDILIIYVCYTYVLCIYILKCWLSTDRAQFGHCGLYYNYTMKQT